ncbi:hypothetical protein Ae201684P_010906 [Aphanomyces euteiches]|nr:hypothetical protein Ae201684P_010906 [Aphanomyces euteiches]
MLPHIACGKDTFYLTQVKCLSMSWVHQPNYKYDRNLHLTPPRPRSSLAQRVLSKASPRVSMSETHVACDMEWSDGKLKLSTSAFPRLVSLFKNAEGSSMLRNIHGNAILHSTATKNHRSRYGGDVDLNDRRNAKER